MKILIVEDSGLMRRAMANIIRGLGHEPVEAADGSEGLKQLQAYRGSIGLVILDWNMPIMDGYTALTKIRSNPKTAEIPILMCTADGIEEDVRKAIKAGANGYLVKPFSPKDLSKQISEMVDGQSVSEH